LGIYALSSYYAGEEKRQGLLIGFAGDDEDVMASGIKALAKIISEASRSHN
jgi:DNA-binding transcriptional MocR family regulator